ncbi:hypothetical protein WOB92_09885 [Vibrio parahaemolyticus]
MENLELKVKNRLKSLGFQVDDIPRSNKQTADYLIESKSIKSIVEVKTMNDTDEFSENYFAQLASGKVFEFVGTKDTRKHINKASVQVSNSYDDLAANGFKCICIYSNVMNTAVDLQRRLYDFYGICDFFCFDSGFQPSFVQCLGFYSSIFDLYHDVDCVMLLSDNSSNLLLNDNSANFEKLNDSSCFELFEKSESWAVFNPKQLITNSNTISLKNRELAVRNPGNISRSELFQHEMSESVIVAKKELCSSFGFIKMGMEQNRGRAFVVGS